jgi:hypothetical protein
MSIAVGAPAFVQAMPVILTDTSTAGVDVIITELAQLLAREGALIDPNLVVTEHDGHLALGTQAGEQGHPMIDLPTHELVPTDGLMWDDTTPKIQLAEGADALSALHRELLDLQIDLWNATDKLAMFRATHPRVAALQDAELRDAIARIRPGFTPGDTTRDLLRTRTFTLRAGESAQSVVMPILELADHHPYGAPFNLRDGRLGANYHFVDDTGLSYVQYGPHRDAIDLACLYGYATDFTTFFVSAPMTLDLKGFGSLIIDRSVQRRSPAAWRIHEGNLRIDYLLLDAYTGLFDVLHRPVREYLIGQGASRAQALSLAIDAAETIMQANHQRLIDVIAATEGLPHRGASTIAIAAAHQRQVIDVIGELA